MSEQPDDDQQRQEQPPDPQLAEAMQAVFASMQPDQDLIIDAMAAVHARWYAAWQAHGIPEYRAAECLVTMIAENARNRLCWPWQRAREVRLRAELPPGRSVHVHHVWLWLLEVTGSLNSSSKAYNFWSGFGGDVAILGSVLAAPILLYRKHNCGIRWCWRLARHDFTDASTGITHALCRKHHPEHPGRKPVTAAHIREQYHLYLGRQVGHG